MKKFLKTLLFIGFVYIITFFIFGKSLLYRKFLTNETIYLQSNYKLNVNVLGIDNNIADYHLSYKSYLRNRNIELDSFIISKEDKYNFFSTTKNKIVLEVDCSTGMNVFMNIGECITFGNNTYITSNCDKSFYVWFFYYWIKIDRDRNVFQLFN